MDGYAIRCIDKNGRYYVLGKGFQDARDLTRSEWLFSALTWRTKEEAEDAARKYLKKCENQGAPIDSCVPIYYWYSGKNENNYKEDKK